MNSKAKKVAVVGMLCALAFITVVVIRIPIILFLKYEAKDIIISLGGFIFGPLTVLIISLIVSFIEMITISTTGYIGFIMNVLSTFCFAGTAAIIYKKKHTVEGAILGLFCGVLVSTAAMLAWNYFLTPIYMKLPREAVADMLIPAFLPFNLFKNTLNAGGALLIYKPVIIGLRKAKLIESSKTNKN